MISSVSIRRVASRAAANLVAVAAISAIFGLKAYIDMHRPEARSFAVAETVETIERTGAARLTAD